MESAGSRHCRNTEPRFVVTRGAGAGADDTCWWGNGSSDVVFVGPAGQTHRRGEELQEDLDAHLVEYNEARPHQRRWCFGRTPMQAFEDGLPLAKEKMLAA